MTINQRVREIRKALDMNQTDFGKRIAIAQGYLTNIENGHREVTEKTIKLICAEFKVSENWLRTGEGQPFHQNDKDFAAALVKEYALDEDDTKIIEAFLNMTPEQRKAFSAFASQLDKLSKGESNT